MSTAAQNSPATPPAAGMSPVARILGAIVSPAKTFDDLARSPGFIACWVLQAAVALAFGLELLRRVGAEAVVRQGILSKPSGRNMDPAALENAVHMGAKFAGWAFYAAPVFVILSLLLLALIFQGVANFFLGQEARYKPVLSLVSHAYLPQTVFALVCMVLMAISADPASFQIANPLGSNLGFFLDPASTSPFLYSLAVHIDAFALWTVALLALGLSKLHRKTSFGGALSAVLGIWGFWLLVQAGLFAL